MFSRYAIYYTPDAATPLASFGASWLGWDSASGARCAHPQVADLDIAEITETPRKYGFHGTLKPPFRLADGTTADELQSALATLCATAAPVTLDGLQLARLGRFLALVPRGDTGALAALAARLVQELDAFRAPATDAELARRRSAGLTPAQDAHLMKWGYPYVMDAFRFHMTLTGKLDKPTAAQTEHALVPLLDPLDLTPYRIGAVTLLGEDQNGMFHQLRRFALTG